MKLTRLTEAKYAGQYKLDDVRAQYYRAEPRSNQDVYFHSATGQCRRESSVS